MKNAFFALRRSKHSLLLAAGSLCLVVVLAALLAGDIFTLPASLRHARNPYDPARFGIPATIGGYKVLAVFTSDNLDCMGPGEIRLALQAAAPNVDAYLANNNLPAIQKELEQRGLNVEIEIDGPGMTIAQIIREAARWNQGMDAYGCFRSGGPAPTIGPQTTIIP